MFSQASVIFLWGVCISACTGAGRQADTLWIDTPQADTPGKNPQTDTAWADTPLGRPPPPRQSLQRTVRIVLECSCLAKCSKQNE